MTIDKQQQKSDSGGGEKMACLRDVGQRLLLLSYFFFKACYTSTKGVVETIILLLSFCPFASIGVMRSDTLAHIENLLGDAAITLLLLLINSHNVKTTCSLLFKCTHMYLVLNCKFIVIFTTGGNCMKDHF